MARTGRPGPVVIDLPKDVLMNKHDYVAPKKPVQHKSYRPQVKPDSKKIEQAVELIAQAKRPIFYIGGGVINSGPKASKLLAAVRAHDGLPITNTLMGSGAFPASDKQFLGMLGMHGTYEANLAMHDCDVMITIGARFDDRVTGKLTEFSPRSKKIHIDIDPSLDQQERARRCADRGRCRHALEDDDRVWKAKQPKTDHKALKAWWQQIDDWRGANCLAYKQDKRDRSSRNTRSSGWMHSHKDRDPTSPPTSASTRCGRRSSCSSSSPTAG